MVIKKNGIKGMLSVIFLILVISISNTNASATTSAINISIDGKLVDIQDAKPFIKDNRTLVPIRVISENLGAKVEWDSAQQTVTLTKNDRTIMMIMNCTTIFKNGRQFDMGVEPVLVNGRTMVPIRFVSEALGVDVKWDANNNEVKISTAMPSSTDANSEDWDNKVQNMNVFDGDLRDLYDVNPKAAREFVFNLYTLANNLDKTGSVTYKGSAGAEASIFVKSDEYKHDIAIIQNDRQLNSYKARAIILRTVLKYEDYEKIWVDLGTVLHDEQKGIDISLSGETENYKYSAKSFTASGSDKLEIYLDKK